LDGAPATWLPVGEAAKRPHSLCGRFAAFTHTGFMPRQKVDRDAVMSEATRVAQAFGFDDFKGHESGAQTLYKARKGGIDGGWYIDHKEPAFKGMLIREDGKIGTASEIYKNEVWKLGAMLDRHVVFFINGLCRLGFDDAPIFERLSCPLSFREQLELRLSIPHELWPQAWLDDENTITKSLNSQ